MFKSNRNEIFMLSRILKIFFICSLSAMLTVFFIKLFSFKEKILFFEKSKNNGSSNIVILTGGTNRIKDGLKIIDDFETSKKINFKILVSGTGKGFSKTSLKKQLGPNFNPYLIECCIDLDSISKNTYTNASETFRWSKKNKIKEFILITSNYHMPRAFLEFTNRMPDLKIYTFTITPTKHIINNWLSSYQTFSLVFKEYCKFIIASLRIQIFRI